MCVINSRVSTYRFLIISVFRTFCVARFAVLIVSRENYRFPCILGETISLEQRYFFVLGNNKIRCKVQHLFDLVATLKLKKY